MATLQAAPIILFAFEQEVMKSDAMKAEYQIILDLYSAAASSSTGLACNVWSGGVLQGALKKNLVYFGVCEVGVGPVKEGNKFGWDHFAAGVRVTASQGRGISKPFAIFDPLEVTRLGQRNCGENKALLDRRESRDAWKARLEDAFAYSKVLRPKEVPFFAYWSASDYLITELGKTCLPL